MLSTRLRGLRPLPGPRAAQRASAAGHHLPLRCASTAAPGAERRRAPGPCAAFSGGAFGGFGSGNGAPGHAPAGGHSAQQPHAPPATPPGSPPPGPSAAAAAGAHGAHGAQQPGAMPGFGAFLKPIYVAIFTVIFVGGMLFASMSLQLTSDMGFAEAFARITRRIFRSIAFRQLVVIGVAIFLVRFALNNVLRVLAKWSSSPVPWDKSKVYYVMKEVYSPLELLLFVAGCCTIADSFLPQLIGVPKATVNAVVRAALSMSFVLGAATVVFNLKNRFCKEQAWQSEMQGNVTSQRRWEAYDKLGTFAIYTFTIFLSIQALGLEVRSVLAIGGIGGLAIGLAGREICENLLNGFLLMTTMPFEVGEEVVFSPNGQTVEGIVLDVGWYRTTIRSFEREVFVIPNAVFSKNTVLNVSRKMREWRFYEYLCVRVQDVHKVNAIIQDIRRIVKNDARIINKLHRRIFLDKITHDDCKVYLSFYVEASNRDAFMAVKQDLLLAFVDCVERNGAALATPRAVLELEDSISPALAAMYSGSAAAAAAARFKLLPVSTSADVAASPVPAGAPSSPQGPAIEVTPGAVISVDGYDAPGPSDGSKSEKAGGGGGGGGSGGSGSGSGGGGNGSGGGAKAAGEGKTAAKDGKESKKPAAAPAAAAGAGTSGGGSGGNGSGASGSGGAAKPQKEKPPPLPLPSPPGEARAPSAAGVAVTAAYSPPGTPAPGSSGNGASSGSGTGSSGSGGGGSASSSRPSSAAGAAPKPPLGSAPSPGGAPSSSGPLGGGAGAGAGGGGGSYRVVTGAQSVQGAAPPPPPGAPVGVSAAAAQPQRDVILASFEEL